MVLYGIKGVDEADLFLSLGISVFTLVYNLYKLYWRARFHGMSFVEYAISVLQLGM